MESLTQVKERPILFNGEMVRAVLEGRKTQTRRVMKPQPVPNEHEHGKHWVSNNDVRSMVDVEGFLQGDDSTVAGCFCPYGKPGDQLWVRETFAYITDSFAISQGVVYRADGKDVFMGSEENLIPEGATVFNALSSEYPKTVKYSPSIHMPRWASRIQLEITDVRVERVQDIDTDGISAEGIPKTELRVGQRRNWIDLWDSIYEKQNLGWQVNPWVWVVEFKRITP